MIPTKLRVGILKANNQPVATRGLLTTAAAAVPDLIHTLPIGRTLIVRKIMWYNNTGFDTILTLGTLTNAGVWFPLLPAVVALNTFGGAWQEADLPDVEFANDRTAGAGGVTGNVYVQAGVAGVGLAGVLVRLSVEEFGR
jgi:hypothetical protein